MKKTYLFLIAGIFLFAMANVSVAQTNENMQNLARNYVPEDAVLIAHEKDDGRNELKFWVDATQEVYEVELSGDGKNVLKMSSEAMDDRGGKSIVLQENDVRNKVLEYYPGAAIESVRIEKENGLYEYDIAVRTDEWYGLITLHAETGAVLERELHYDAAPAVNGNDQKDYSDAQHVQPAQQQSDGLIGMESAKSIAISKAGGGRVASIRLEKDDGRQVYDGKVLTDTHEYEFEIDAQTGKIREWDADRLERNERDDDWDDD